MHGLAENLEALDLLNRVGGRLCVLKDDKSLSFSLQVRLGDDLENISILGEDGGEGRFQGVNLDALLEVADVDSVQEWSA